MPSIYIQPIHLNNSQQKWRINWKEDAVQANGEAIDETQHSASHFGYNTPTKGTLKVGSRENTIRNNET